MLLPRGAQRSVQRRAVYGVLYDARACAIMRAGGASDKARRRCRAAAAAAISPLMLIIAA